MAVKASHIRVTPLYGGRSETSACTLLEVGGARILLDCGASLLGISSEETSHIHQLAKDLVSAGGVDAILLSHADLHHIGALPIIAGQKGLQEIPILSTLPVHKFAQLTLYDYLSNMKNEGDDVLLPYDYDDIDHAFHHVITLKYCQHIDLPETRQKTTEKRQVVSVSAIPSGRTLGGAIWRIRCGPAEIVYAMDINLRKEVVLDGASMDLFPSSPTLLITEAACASRAYSTLGKKKKDKDDLQQLLSQILIVLRRGGNVLLPVETTARILEYLVLFNRYWTENKLGLYHLIFLSHMSRNVLECARTQLEWTSDSLTRSFYNGKPNPFELPAVKCITNVQTMDRKFHGPKVVFATDAALSHGQGKEVLLRWGGDPRCLVIFPPDTSPSNSLAAQLRQLSQNPPVIASVQHPVKEELVGAELAAFRVEQERQRRAEDEERQRKRRQAEIAQLTATQKEIIREEEDEEEDGHAYKKARQGKSGKAAANAIWSVLQPNLQVFERKEDVQTMDEYGLSIDDLRFQDIQSTEVRHERLVRDRVGTMAAAGGVNGAQSASAGGASRSSDRKEANGLSKGHSATSQQLIESVPYKTKSVTERVQFTCGFLESSPGIAGRLDLKAFKALLARITPARLFVLRGSEKDCDTLIQLAQQSGMEAYAPRNRRSATLSVHTERLRVQIPQSLLPRQYAKLQRLQLTGSSIASAVMTGGAAAAVAAASVGAGGLSGECGVFLLQGSVSSLGANISGQEGMRLIKYQGEAAVSAQNVLDVNAEEGRENNKEENGQLEGSNTAVENGTSGGADPLSSVIAEEGRQDVGAISLGEVTLNQLKQQLEAQGLKVDFNIGSQGGALVCNDQVVVRKENNDVVIEGPPVKAYFDTRRVVYQQFAFL